MGPHYLFGVTRAGAQIPAFRVRGGPVRLLTRVPLALIALSVQESEFSGQQLQQNMADDSWINLWGALHMGVISRVFSTTSLLPFRFGTVSQSPPSALRLMDSKMKSLERYLEAIWGCEEYRLDLVPLPEARCCLPLTPNGEGKVWPPDGWQRGPGDPVLALEPGTESLVKRRRPLSFPGKGSGVKEAVLVRRESGLEFRQEIILWGRGLQAEGLILKLSGPLPPFSFAVDPALL